MRHILSVSIFRVLALALVLNVVAPDCSVAQESPDAKPWSVDFSSAFLTDYMFRGQELYRGTAVQPSVGTSYATDKSGTFGASVWSHISANQGHKDENFSEVDYTLSYSFTAGPATLSLANLWYTFSHDNTQLQKNTHEASVTFALDALLTPTFSYFRDYGAFDSNYYEFTLSETLEPASLGEGFNITPSVAFGFASSADKIYADSGLVQTTYGLSSEVKFGVLTLTPTISYTKGYDANTVNQIWGGFTLSYSL